MTTDQHDEAGRTRKGKDDETLRTFDMYGHLSRPTVILAILFVIVALLVMLYGFLTHGQTV